jgi:hypothetical protein|tara:strand:+ start:445 stop:822 length:378 start_codon:yes stop_codon:yes gene_type:complete
MATLNLTSTISASGLTSDSISSSVLKSATVTQGGIARMNITSVVGGTAQVVAAHADHTAGAYVYLKNADATRTIFIKVGAGAIAINDITLLPGAWAVFPWSAATSNIEAYASAATGSLLEHSVFE